jgi:peroxiredoxin
MRISSLIAILALAVTACVTGRDTGPDGGTAVPGTTVSGERRPRPSPPPDVVEATRRRPAPALRVTAFDGRTITLAGLRGRPVVVSFFESWCPVCQAEQPGLSRVARELEGEAGFVGVSYRDTEAAGRAYGRRFDVPYPLANDASGRIWARWQVPFQPVTVVVDKQGRIAARFDRAVMSTRLRATLAYLAGE